MESPSKHREWTISDSVKSLLSGSRVQAACLKSTPSRAAHQGFSRQAGDLFATKLAERDCPTFDVIRSRDLAIFDDMYVDRHNFEALPRGLNTEEGQHRSARRFATDDNLVARDLDLLIAQCRSGMIRPRTLNA